MTHAMPTIEETTAKGQLFGTIGLLGAMLDEIARMSGDRFAVSARVRKAAEVKSIAMAKAYESEFDWSREPPWIASEVSSTAAGVIDSVFEVFHDRDPE